MENQKEAKVWFITGTSRGFGRIWAEAALKRGDKVAATARKLSSIADFAQKYGENVLTLELDVTDKEQVNKAVNQAHAHFGKLDIVLNNAGYSLVGTIEEAEEEDIKAMFKTNFFGPLAVVKAALPLLRKQGYGHIIGVSSTLGLVSLPVIGYYASSKWAMEAAHEALAAEVKQFGIKVTIIEPGAYATEFGSQNSLKFADNMDIYTGFKNGFMEQIKNSKQGDPQATPEALFAVVDSDNPPLRFFLGNQNFPWVQETYKARNAEWEAWKEISDSAQGNVVKES
ncbi:SDR family NAD(P)-dependent oxidoreductase [Pedobacter sp. HMF7647]|uniref:SDR family NAD(P)-dependent oxidoreductase n=1 Tax=Hufsiella arboris TaxID=2695275 RepID=A0A7K1YAA5_9SPHI|nr:SDR family NAD(P)-dependent oxidoreductase [Hufsiella arboris]MXV51506.1 SDR family NAD(P)-dependent oxidoreductase [Hufsiella arboris]